MRAFFTRASVCGTFAAFILASGCANHGSVHSRTEVETTADLSVDDGHRRVRAYCIDSASVLEIDGARFLFPGHRGYRGDLGTTAGELTIGAVRFGYDAEKVHYVGDDASGTVDLAARPRLSIEQSGHAAVLVASTENP